MRWEDERWVRLYTRDTPEFLSLSWQARAVFILLLRKVDRAGILTTGKLGKKGIAVAIGAPWIDIETSVDELLADGCLMACDDGFIVPSFVPAQEAVQSNRARQSAYRERARDAKLASNTSKQTSLHDVTPTIRDVTKLRNERNAEDISSVTSLVSARAGRGETIQDKTRQEKKPAPHGDGKSEHVDSGFKAIVDLYFAEYEAARGDKPAFGGREGKAIHKLIVTLKTHDRVKDAIRGCYGDPWWRTRASILDISKDPSKYIGSKGKTTSVQTGRIGKSVVVETTRTTEIPERDEPKW
jgi:hypothetical protein